MRRLPPCRRGRSRDSSRIRQRLKKILLYHVVSGSVTADKVVGLTSATSVEGSPIAIAVKDGTVSLNDSAKVVTTDVIASNGVIHVIDQVVLAAGRLIAHPTDPAERVGPVSSSPTLVF